MSEDLISRQAAIDAIRESTSKYTGFMEMEMYTDDDAVEAINGVPSAQPERKKGKWIRHDEIKNVYGGICIECSECGEKYVVQHILDEKYCRNCGADMRERKDFQVIVNGNCTKCGKPLSGNRIFICEECEEQSKESE